MDYQDPLVVDPANGVVRGDSKAMPNRGTSSGFVGTSGSYGADTGPNATNRMGAITDTGSDPMDLCYPKGDIDRFSSSGHSTTDPGSGMGGAAKSDDMDETEPGESAAQERAEGPEESGY
jgi:hypothetical protein